MAQKAEYAAVSGPDARAFSAPTAGGRGGGKVGEPATQAQRTNASLVTALEEAGAAGLCAEEEYLFHF